MTKPLDGEGRRQALITRLSDRIESLDRASDGGGKGYQCVDCGEWDREHATYCNVLFYRQLESVLRSVPAARQPQDIRTIAAEMREWTRGDGDVFDRLSPTTRHIRQWADELDRATAPPQEQKLTFTGWDSHDPAPPQEQPQEKP
jgi:hypothetical protein